MRIALQWCFKSSDLVSYTGNQQSYLPVLILPTLHKYSYSGSRSDMSLLKKMVQILSFLYENVCCGDH